MAHAAEIPQFDNREREREIAAANERKALLGFPLSVGSGADMGAGESSSTYRTSSLQGNSLDSVYESISDAIAACTPYLRSSAETARGFGRRVKEMKEEKPLQFLGIVAGSAFVLGMMVRFWRSRS